MSSCLCNAATAAGCSVRVTALLPAALGIYGPCAQAQQPDGLLRRRGK